MSNKGRLSVSIDAELIEGISRSVAAGRAKNASEWTTRAVRAALEDELRIAAMSDLLAEYQREHGAFTEAERGTGLTRLRARTVAKKPSRARKAG
jgi:Arc/MetJ-type ribon-helix-helix transcriptional regulator